jgi:hypothetical protein
VKRDVSVLDGRFVVRPKAEDAIAKVRQMNLRKKVATGRLSDQERDVALLALLQLQGLLLSLKILADIKEVCCSHISPHLPKRPNKLRDYADSGNLLTAPLPIHDLTRHA